MAKKPKRRYTRLIDLILNAILLVVFLFTIWRAVRLNMLPMNWLMAFIAVLVVVFLIFFVLMLMNTPKWIIVIKRVIQIGLCIAVGFVGYSLGNVTSAVNQVSVADMNEPIQIYLLARKGGEISSNADFSGRSLGVQSGTDLDNSDYGCTQLEAALTTPPVYHEEIAYNTLAELFLSNMIDGMMISDSYLDMLNANVEGFSDSYTVIDTYERERPQNSADQKDITREGFTLLISGVDEMGSADMTSLSDVNILMFINPVSNSISMVSLHRDSLMPRPSLGNVNDKLTHTGWGGVQDTVETVEEFFNIDIDYYAKVSFSSLIEIVDAIGGIDVDVEIGFTEQDENRSFAAEDVITLEAGYQHLNGKQALAYARHRKTENYDVAGRERAQERIIKAIIDKLLTAEGITRYVNKLMETVPKYVVTDMPGNQITAFIRGELKELKPWSIQSITIDNGIYDTRVVPNLAQGADCFLWNQYDYAKVVDAYQANQQQQSFREFSFSFPEYMKYLPAVSDSWDIVWDYMATTPH